MADLETKLRWLSERGDHVGAEELIARIEADLAGAHLVVVAKRRETTTKTRRAPTISRPNRYTGPAWAMVAFVAIFAVAGMYLALSGGRGGEVVDTPPPAMTVPDIPPTTGDTDVETKPVMTVPDIPPTTGDRNVETNPVEAGAEAAFRLAGGEGPGGPWSYWVWTAHCESAGSTVLYQWVEYAPLRGGIGIGGERCAGGESRVQPHVVEQMGVGGDGWGFLYGQTALDVVRVKVRLVDGREFEVDTLTAPDELGWNARFYVVLLPVDFGGIETVRGYDASGQDVGGGEDLGEGFSG